MAYATITLFVSHRAYSYLTWTVLCCAAPNRDLDPGSHLVPAGLAALKIISRPTAELSSLISTIAFVAPVGITQ